MDVLEKSAVRSVQTFTIIRAFIGAVILMESVGLSKSFTLKNLTAPSVADLRDDITLDCTFDMGAEVLYAVKWYKGEHEFFRYTPLKQPNTDSFPVPGVHLKTEATACGNTRCKIQLTDLTTAHSGGSYACEISSEAPAFRLASIVENITVAALPKKDPSVTGLLDMYNLDDQLSARCGSDLADPRPVIHWYINDKPADPSQLGTPILSPIDNKGLASTILELKFQIQKNLLDSSNNINLRCDVSQPMVPLKPKTVTNIVRVNIPQPPPPAKRSSSSNAKPWNHLYLFILLVGSVKWQKSC